MSSTTWFGGDVSVATILDMEEIRAQRRALLQHVFHLEQSPTTKGIKGVCGCGKTFDGVTNPALLMEIISDHCAPIGG